MSYATLASRDLTASEEAFAARMTAILTAVRALRADVAAADAIATGDLCERDGIHTLEDELAGLAAVASANLDALGL